PGVLVICFSARPRSPRPTLFPYTTLFRSLAPEVRVNAIAPGTITMPGDPPEWETDFIKLAPLRRSGKPSEIADAVLFLVHSKFIDRKSTRLNSSHVEISYAVFCLKKKRTV